MSELNTTKPEITSMEFCTLNIDQTRERATKFIKKNNKKQKTNKQTKKNPHTNLEITLNSTKIDQKLSEICGAEDFDFSHLSDVE